MRNLRREPSSGTLYFWLSLNAALVYPPKVHHVEARLLVLTWEVNQNPGPTVGSSRRPPDICRIPRGEVECTSPCNSLAIVHFGRRGFHVVDSRVCSLHVDHFSQPSRSPHSWEGAITPAPLSAFTATTTTASEDINRMPIGRVSDGHPPDCILPFSREQESEVV